MRVEASRAARTRRTGLGFGAAIFTSTLVLFLVTLVAGGVFLLSPGGASSVAAAFLRAQPGSIRWDEHTPLNVLLIGTNGPSSPATALMVVSYNPAGQSLSMLSIPTNLWVTVPGSGQSTVDEAYSVGGPSVTVQTIESITHVVIPYFVAMNPDTMSRWIDALGGVKVHVDVPLSGRSRGTYAMLPGTRHLNGAQALTFAFSSSPYDTGESDRLQRQQTLFSALLRHDIAAPDLIRLPQVVNGLGGSIHTNFPYDQIPDLARMLTAVSTARTRGNVISTVDGTASAYQANNETVLLPDRQRIRTIAQGILANPPIGALGQVAVLNGSGVQGQAASLALWLQQSRIRVREVASAPSYAFKRTEIWLPGRAARRAVLLAHDIAALLHAPIVRHSMAGQRADVGVVIGGDYQDPTQQ